MLRDTEWDDWSLVCLGWAVNYKNVIHYSKCRTIRTQIAILFYTSREGIDMTVVINSEDVKRQFAKDSMDWLDSIPDDRHEWCDALIAGAIDECRGDLLKALAMAKAQYVETPVPPEDEDPDPSLVYPEIPEPLLGDESDDATKSGR